MARELPDGLPVLRALGVAPIARMIRGEISRGEAIRAGQADTRAYIKRQNTWTQKHMMSWMTIDLQ
jgi:tRNA dimethylallyltransferase